MGIIFEGHDPYQNAEGTKPRREWALVVTGYCKEGDQESLRQTLQAQVERAVDAWNPREAVLNSQSWQAEGVRHPTVEVSLPAEDAPSNEG